MTLEEKIAKAFKLQGDNWMKHANPLSVWTRFATLPFLVLAIWSRVWIGWYAVIPVGVLVLWLFINPTLFKKPESLDNWGSKAVLGEKYWSGRKKNPVPQHHKTPVLILNILLAIGSVVLIIGLWKLDGCLSLIGIITVYLTKMWFLDRMVWIYTEMHPDRTNQT